MKNTLLEKSEDLLDLGKTYLSEEEYEFVEWAAKELEEGNLISIEDEKRVKSLHSMWVDGIGIQMLPKLDKKKSV